MGTLPQLLNCCHCLWEQMLFVLHADCDVYWIQTPTGPGGMSGPLRVDLEGRWTGHAKQVMREYSWHEAQAAFERTAANHRQSGWGPPGR